MAESNSDDARDCYWLGDKYYFGKNVLRDYDKARRWYEKAAALGFRAAQKKLDDMDVRNLYQRGENYRLGEGVPRDDARACREYAQAAAQGHEKSLRLLRQLAEQNVVAAQRCLAVLYRRGAGVPRDGDTARRWYEKAVAQGDAEARYELGVMYDDGEGVARDYDRARQ